MTKTPGKRRRPKLTANNTTEQIALRIPVKLLNAVDRSVAEQLIKVPRNTWVLEAIVEKLIRSGKRVA